MGKHPLDTCVIESGKPLVFQQVLEIGSKPVVLSYADSIEQHIQYRKQHDTRKVRYHKSRCDGKRFVHEDGAGYTAHKDQRYEYGDGSER